MQVRPAGHQLKSHRPHAVRPPDRYGRVHAVRNSPSDVAACQRAVRRHTHSPVIRRSMRATQARAAPGVHIGQPAQTHHQMRAMRPAMRARGVPGQHDGRSVASTVCHETPRNATVCQFLPPLSAGPLGTTAAHPRLRCRVHPRPRALRSTRVLVCARPRVYARPHHQVRARRTRATRRHDARNLLTSGTLAWHHHVIIETHGASSSHNKYRTTRQS